MADKRFKAMYSEKLSKEYDPRYVIVDTETGEIMDDAQGYGYRSSRKAYAAWGYKHADKSVKMKRKQTERKVRQFCKEHHDFVNFLDEIAFEIAKGSWGPDDKVDETFINEEAEEYGISLEEAGITAKDFLRYW